jgi:Protein of unknown function (DUF2800)
LSTHSLLAPSAAERWIQCPKSVHATKDVPDVEKDYSAEGTLGHDIAKAYLLAWLDFGGAVPDYELATLRANRLWSQHLEEAALEYVEQVKLAYAKARAVDESAVIHVERRVSLESVLPEPGAGGTVDVRIVYGRTVEVRDLKMGVGVPVSAVGNEQCRLYAYGVLQDIKDYWDIDRIEVFVHQPRLGSVTHEELDRADLEKWIEDVVRPAALNAWNNQGEFKAGTWCQFCKIRTSCRARAEQHILDAAEVFKSVQADEAAATWSLEQVAELLPKIPALRKFLLDVEEFAMKEARAGRHPPGFELDEGRSIRVVTDLKVAAEALVAAGTPEPLLFERVMLSLTELERALGKKFVKDTIGHLIKKPPGKPKLVLAGTARKAIDRTEQAKEAFTTGDSNG